MLVSEFGSNPGKKPGNLFLKLKGAAATCLLLAGTAPSYAPPPSYGPAPSPNPLKSFRAC